MKRVILLLGLLLTFTTLYAEKIKEIANVIGVRENQLIGYGLVVGLNGTGDGSSSEFTIQSLSNLLQTVNVKIDPDDIKSKNTAAVIVTATLPPFARQGDNLNVVISSIGDANSLEGGMLLMTPLKGVDGSIYALAQGSVTIGGMNSKGNGQLNHSTAGNIFNGAIVEREIAYDIYTQSFANLSLEMSNFKTAISIEKKLNEHFDDTIATAIDPRTIRMKKPKAMSMVEFLAQALDVQVDYEKEEKIVIDERTGTVISGVGIEVDPVVITHGEMTIKIEPSAGIDPDATEDVYLKDGVSLSPKENLMNMEQKSITVANVTRALNKLGATPKDIISILENMKRAGAIRAKLEVI